VILSFFASLINLCFSIGFSTCQFGHTTFNVIDKKLLFKFKLGPLLTHFQTNCHQLGHLIFEPMYAWEYWKFVLQKLRGNAREWSCYFFYVFSNANG
jgi:hypothetical protein